MAKQAIGIAEKNHLNAVTATLPRLIEPIENAFEDAQGQKVRRYSSILLLMY